MLISSLLITANQHTKTAEQILGDIIDYVISPPAIFNNIQNLSPDHFAILFDFSSNINKSTSLPIKVKLLAGTLSNHCSLNN